MDKISKKERRSFPCSVKNGRGDVIYRHGCQITNSSCGDVEAMCFLVYSSLQHSTVWCCVLSCGWVEGVRTWAVFLSAHGKKATPPVPFFSIHPSSSSFALLVSMIPLSLPPCWYSVDIFDILAKAVDVMVGWVTVHVFVSLHLHSNTYGSFNLHTPTQVISSKILITTWQITNNLIFDVHESTVMPVIVRSRCTMFKCKRKWLLYSETQFHYSGSNRCCVWPR